MTQLRGLLALALWCCTGCAVPLCHLPDDCAHALSQTQLGWEIHDVCHSCNQLLCGCPQTPGGCCDAGYDCTVEGTNERCVQGYDESQGVRPLLARHREPRFVVGPPPVCYEPPMPPKFLPVPARSVFTSVNMHAPTPRTGQVEMGYDGQMRFPAGN
jgi:hypothetical protein